MDNKIIFTAGGTVQAGGGIYIPRNVDKEFYDFCLSGEFAYILTARQLGKSSLMIRTKEKLSQAGIIPVIVDLQGMGVVDINAEQWYFGFLTNVAQTLNLNTDLSDFWQNNYGLGIIHRFTRFFEEVVLKKNDKQIVIFVDEIDTTLKLDFTDDFFIAIRSFYNRRAENPDLKRLSFVLIGVATPGDLIAGYGRTPFNIGHRVDLTDFTKEEAQPLIQGFNLPDEKAKQILHWIFKWTGGHPYLTLRLCKGIVDQNMEKINESDIDNLAENIFITQKNEQDNHLMFIRDMLIKKIPGQSKVLQKKDKKKKAKEEKSKKTPEQGRVLQTYREILKGKKKIIDEEQSIIKNYLKLSGIVKARNQILQVRNPIYSKVFNESWIKEHLLFPWEKVGKILTIIMSVFLILSIILFLLASYAAYQRKQLEIQKAIAEKNERIAKENEQKAQEAKDIADQNLREAIAQKDRADKEALKAEEAKKRADCLRYESNYILARLFEEKATTVLKNAWKTGDKTSYQKAWLYTLEALHQDIGKKYWTPLFFGRLFLQELPHMSFSELAVLAGHKYSVESIAFSPSGKLIATGSKDKTIRLWDVETGKELAVLGGHNDSVLAVAFSPSGKKIASGSDDTTIRLWDAETGKVLAVLQGHTGSVLSVVFHPAGRIIASGAGDKTIRLWDAETGRALAVFEGHTGPILSIAFHPGGRMITSGSADKTIRLWDTDTGKELTIFQGNTDSVLAVAFSPDGKRLVSGSRDGFLRVRDIESKTILVARQYTGTSLKIAFHPEVKYFAIGLNDNTIRLWNPETLEELAILKGHIGSILSLSFSPDGKKLASGSYDKTIRLWDTEKGKSFTLPEEDKKSTYIVALSSDWKQLASGLKDNIIKLWNTGKRTDPFILKGPTDSISSIAFSPDGKQLASGSGDKTIRLWNAVKGQGLYVLQGHLDSISGVAFSPDGKELASVSKDNTIRLWDVKTGKALDVFSGSPGAVSSVDFSPDGKWIASRSGDNTILLWDTKTRKKFFVLKGHTAYVSTTAFSPDGKQLASGSADQTIRLWNIETGKEHTRFAENVGFVHILAYSPDGKQLASGSTLQPIQQPIQQLIQLWDVERGKELNKLKGHTGSVSIIVFSPDGKYLASGSDDQTIRLWNVQTGKEVLVLETNKNIKLIAFNIDGRKLILLTKEGTIVIYDFPVNFLENYQKFRMQAKEFDKIYRASYYILPYQLNDFELLKASPYLIKPEHMPGSKEEDFKRLLKPRPPDENPLRWILENVN